MSDGTDRPPSPEAKMASSSQDSGRRKRRVRWVVAGLAFLALFYFWARKHTDRITGDQRWSVNCIPCHLLAGPLSEGTAGKVRYVTPWNLAVSPKGDRLYVCACESDALIEVDAVGGRVLRSIPVGQRPLAVCVTRDGRTAYVTNQWSHNVSVVDLAAGKEVRKLATGRGPSGLALDKDELNLYVANTYDGSISVIEVGSGKEIKRLAGSNEPFDVHRSPRGDAILVSSRLARAPEQRSVPAGEVTEINPVGQVVRRRHFFNSAHQIDGVAAAEGLVLAAFVVTKNLIPATGAERGWLMSHALGVVMLGSDNEEPEVCSLLLDSVNQCYADPADVVISPDGATAYVSHAGADTVSVVDIGRVKALLDRTPATRRAILAHDLSASREYVTARIRTAECPKGMAMSPDGRFLYVAASLADQVQVIDTASNAIAMSIPLGGPKTVTYARAGARVFNSAKHAFQGQFSCRSCHPDGHVDGLVYDLESDGVGKDIVDNRTLRELQGSTPLKWSGVSSSLYRQCGPRFAMFISRSEALEPATLLSLVAYIQSIRHPPRGDETERELTPAQARGKAIFERTTDNFRRPIPVENRCNTCHPPPRYTDRRQHDVGSGKQSDASKRFDTPGLEGVAHNAPYLHDGSSPTLEEIWTRFNDADRHGVSSDMTKEQMNDLVEYLKTL